MKKNLLPSILTVLIAGTMSMKGNAQNVTWTDTFTTGVAPTAAQITTWDNWRASLVPGQYTFMTIKGTFDKVGFTCTDKTIVNDFATAVKANTTYISGTTGGHVWSICNRYLGEIWIDPLASCSPSNCPTINGYLIRPGIGTANTNWGGVNSNTCGAPTQRMTFIFGKPSKPNEMGIASFSNPDICTYLQNLSAKISNTGTNYVDSFRLYWSVNNVLQTPFYITGHLKSGNDTTIVLKAAFTFTGNTAYKFKIWTHRPNGLTDSVASNDTLVYNLSFFGNPSPPGTSNVIQCGNGKPFLQATPASPADSILWYTAATGGTFLGIGRNITGPLTTQTVNYYAQAMKLGVRTTLTTGAATTGVNVTQTNYYGGMLNISVGTTIVLDSITVRLWYAAPPSDFILYYKTGSFGGFETNAGAWTQVNKGRARYFVTGGQYFARVATKTLILAGGSYSFYYTVDIGTGGAGNSLFTLNPGILQSNTEMTISPAGTVVIGLFGSTQVLASYRPYMEFMYSKQCTNPIRTALKVTVKPRPTGSDIVKGPTFQGQFRVGDATTPDITEAGKTITYNMTPPPGETNSGHGNTWIVNGVIAKTKYGKSLSSGTDFVWSPPSSGGPGTITFTPKSFYIDSFITFSINYSDLGPYFCDSTLKRTVVIAPTPWPNFKVPPSICLGDAILFDNATTIQSGNATYTWYFGNGDSSDLQSPVYIYKNSGVYTVRLVARSFPWKILHDTTITIEVGELPVTKFRVNNKCQGLPVTFQNQTIVGNGVLTYDWDFGDGSPHSTATNPSHQYPAPGGYKVTLKATANGCISILMKNAYMFARPVANFAAPLAPVCASSELLFPNTSTIALGDQGAFWTFGDGDGSTQKDGIHSYTSAGTFSVKLLAVSEFDCKDSITQSVTIKPTPHPDFVGNQFCGKIPTKFTNKTVEALPNPVYNWTFSDNFTSTQKNITRTWPFEGPFSATLKASYSNGCSASVTKDFKVQVQPKANFSVFDICSGESARFVNSSEGDIGNIQYFWDFGNGITSTIPVPQALYNPAATTTYTVTLVASYPGACSDTLRKTITVSEAPKCDFTISTLGFLKVKLNPGVTTYPKYEWFFGEGGTSRVMNPTYQYKYAGNFKVTLHATNIAGCTCEKTVYPYVTLDVDNPALNNNIAVYPNPNTGTFTVSNPQALKLLSGGAADNQVMLVEVFNLLGSRIYENTSDGGDLQVNLENQADGIYLVKITINGFSTTAKINITN